MSASKNRVLHRSLRETPPKAVGGDGMWLIAEDGRRILDGSGGAAVSCLGHQHPRVIEAIARQASKLAYAHTGFFSSEPAEALADHLVGDQPGGLAYAYFVSGGSEAIEPASNWRGNILSKAVNPSASISPPAARATMATRWERCRQAVTPGAVNPMRRCCRRRSVM